MGFNLFLGGLVWVRRTGRHSKGHHVLEFLSPQSRVEAYFTWKAVVPFSSHSTSAPRAVWGMSAVHSLLQGPELTGSTKHLFRKRVCGIGGEGEESPDPCLREQ